MPKNEDGEFELVMGNKQLLSIVFVVMVLFGIVFTMGYFVGRNSTPESASASAPQQTADTAATGRPVPAEGTAPAAPIPTASAPPDAPLVPGEAKVSTSSVETAPAQTPPASVPEARPAAQPPVTPPVRTATVTPEGQPTAGETFLQVAAVRRPEAELIVDVLKKKGFPAMLAPVPNDTLFRVIVGPLRDAAAIGKTKADLETAGFRSIVRKY